MKHFEAVSFLTTLVAMLCLVTQPCSARGKDSKWNIVLHPAKRSIVLVGDGTNIRVHCEPGLTHDISLNIEANNPDTVRVLTPQLNISVSGNPGTENSNDSDSDMESGPVCGHIRILGIKPGSVGLKIAILRSNGSLAARPIEDYVVTVVRRVDVLQDAFMYVLSTAQVMVLLMLGWRLRSAAVKEVLCRPCTLIGAILCQTLLMPLVTLGVSIALSLPVHSVVSLLIVGCCPAGVLSPVFAVLQQAHVELAVVLLLIETAAAFGAMPLWLFTYGHFLGLAYNNVTFPFLHIAGALLAVAGPITLGISLQRCTPRHLPGIDKAVQPTSLLLVLVASTVRLHATWRHWELATWRLVLGCALVPVGGALMGSVATAIFRQKLPQVKTVAIVTSLQNTLLATVILQTSFPAPDASLMAVTVTCLDVTSLALCPLGRHFIELASFVDRHVNGSLIG